MYNIIIMVVVYLVVQMSLMWLIYRLLKNPSVVDASWSIGLMMSGLIYLWSKPGTPRNEIISLLVVVWALRLAGYLWYTRIHQGHLDKRYTELSTNWKISPSLGFLLNFQLQGFLILIISFVFFLISRSNSTHLSLIDEIAVVVVISGIIGESVADLQLNRFKSQHKGEVCNTGLWNYSRHPNYFFDWITWSGFTLMALQSSKGYLGVVSLLLLYIIFTRVTGPLTERGSVQSKGQKYIDYQRQTSMFFPWIRATLKEKIDSE